MYNINIQTISKIKPSQAQHLQSMKLLSSILAGMATASIATNLGASSGSGSGPESKYRTRLGPGVY